MLFKFYYYLLTEDKQYKFKSIQARQNFIRENNIKHGKCWMKIKTEILNDYYFSIQ